MKDTAIIEAIKSGNDREISKGFNHLAKHYKEIIIRFVLNNSGDAMDAEDLYSEVTQKLYNNIAVLDTYHYGSPLKHYLFKIAQNTWLYELRRKKKRLEHQSHQLDEKIGLIRKENQAFENSFKLLSLDQIKSFIQFTKNAIGVTCYRLLKQKYVNDKKYTELEKLFPEYKNIGTLKVKMNRCKNQAQKKLYNYYKGMRS